MSRPALCVMLTGSPTILVVTYAFAAVCCIVMILMRSRSRERAQQLWVSSTLAHALRAAIEGATE